jgi:hypothetical protein
VKTASSGGLAIAEQRWPGPLYIDSSALAKIYLPATDSDKLDAALRSRRDLMVSDLAVTEIVSALARRRREGAVSPQIAARLQRAILHDLESGVYLRLGLSPAVHRDAERMLFSLEAVPLRAADALHLAIAIAASAASIVTFDRRMIAAALRLGLSPLPG